MTAQAISEPVVQRLIRAVVLLGGLIGAVIIIRFGRLIISSRALSLLLAVAIVGVGMTSLIQGFLPLLGLLAVVAGLLFAFRKPRRVAVVA